MRRTLTVLPLLVAVACASAGAAPEVTLRQMTSVPDVRVRTHSGVPVDYQLRIVNPFEHEVRLVSVEIESVGASGAYEMKRVRHSFDHTIDAKSSRSFDLRAWVQPLQIDDRGNTDQPVLVRGTARFESPAGPMRRNFVTRAQ